MQSIFIGPEVVVVVEVEVVVDVHTSHITEQIFRARLLTTQSSCEMTVPQVADSRTPKHNPGVYLVVVSVVTVVDVAVTVVRVVVVLVVAGAGMLEFAAVAALVVVLGAVVVVCVIVVGIR